MAPAWRAGVEGGCVALVLISGGLVRGASQGSDRKRDSPRKVLGGPALMQPPARIFTEHFAGDLCPGLNLVLMV